MAAGMGELTMADSTARIGLPYIVQNQAQKEVTINQCLDIMDFYTGPVVKSFLSTLPDSPSDGDAYVLTGTVHPNYIAHRVNGAWEYYAPFDGCRILNNGDAIEYITQITPGCFTLPRMLVPGQKPLTTN
jgi:hypothetical protein